MCGAVVPVRAYRFWSTGSDVKTSFVQNIFVLRVCVYEVRESKEKSHQNDSVYSYPGGKSISSLSLSLSLSLSRRQPSPAPPVRVPAPPRFSATPTARPLAKPIPRPTDALPHALPMPEAPRSVLGTVSCRTIPAVCLRHDCRSNHHVVFFLMTTTTPPLV